MLKWDRYDTFESGECFLTALVMLISEEEAAHVLALWILAINCCLLCSKVIVCPGIPLPVHAVQVSCNKHFRGQCVFDCVDGHVRTGGDDVRVCEYESVWSGDDIVCSGKLKGGRENISPRLRTINSSPLVPHACVSELSQHWFR